MGYPEVEEITGTCFVCNDQVAVGQLVYATEESTHGITDCGKHSEDEIQLKIKEIEEASCVKLIAKMRFGSEVQASANHYASRTPQPINDGGPRMLPKDTQIPYREADYLVQNMPPPANDSTANGALLLQTEKILNLAYGWSQIQVAVRIPGPGQSTVLTLTFRSIRLQMRATFSRSSITKSYLQDH